MMYKALEISDKEETSKNVNFPARVKAEDIASNVIPNPYLKKENAKMSEIDNLLAQLNN